MALVIENGSVIGGTLTNASEINYSNSGTSISATTVQGALTELNENIAKQPTLLGTINTLNGSVTFSESLENFKEIIICCSAGNNARKRFVAQNFPTALIKANYGSASGGGTTFFYVTCTESTSYMFAMTFSFENGTSCVNRGFNNVGFSTFHEVKIYGIS